MKATTALVIVAMLLSVAVACGDSGASSSPTHRADDAADLDPNLLTAVALRGEDLPAGYATDLSFSPPGQSATGYNAAFRTRDVSISSNVVRYVDTASLTKELPHLRNGFVKFIGPESAYRIGGSDAAFLYSGGTFPAQATIMVKGRYMVSVAFQAQAQSAAAAVTDRAELDRLSALVFDRLEKLLADPSSATAVVGAPTFETQQGGGAPAVVTATP
ncbi:MAG: hypothetical protein M3P30_09300 [Chloroflexota bacterium]|nr:hypothetical protein [Chloroflexota bacterium]